MNPFQNGSIQGVYVIHVRHFTDRAAHVKAQLGSAGIPFEFIEPYDPDQIDDQTRKHLILPDAKTSPNALSAALKHMEALRRIVARGQRMALVFEDDVILHKRFTEHLVQFLEEAKQLDPPYSILIGSGGNMFVPGKQLQPGRHLYPAQEVRAADAYLIGAEAARRRLDWVERNKIHLPPDLLFNVTDKAMGIRLYWTEPTIVDQGSMNGLFPSAIDYGRGNRARRYVKARFLLQRLRRKYLYRMLK